ncbi:DUF2399 domain-containing protein, partial [Micromonospora fulviviridis]|uniref:DUF2399 domain-containing protein n=1 Tax=Micromonospora fulviviridis TaxID=47860 RepID=UPI0037A60CF3
AAPRGGGGGGGRGGGAPPPPGGARGGGPPPGGGGGRPPPPATGAQLRYHGDFDGEGLRIAAHLMSRTNAQPWLLQAHDYQQAVPPAGPPVGRVDDTPWDPQLAEVVRAHGVALLEEMVVDSLLADMASGSGTSRGRKAYQADMTHRV